MFIMFKIYIYYVFYGEKLWITLFQNIVSISIPFRASQQKLKCENMFLNLFVLTYIHHFVISQGRLTLYFFGKIVQ